jgi:hypothetical protein
VPVASTTVVHSCALAETVFQLGRGGAQVKEPLSIELVAAGEAGPSAEVKISGIGPGYSAKGQSSKKLTFSVERLPTLDACIAWGYVPQLGLSGCLPSETCTAAKPEELSAEFKKWKAANP